MGATPSTPEMLVYDLHWMRTHVKTLESVQSDPFASAEDIKEELYYTNLRAAWLSQAMPSLTFASNFWRSLVDFVDLEETQQRLRRLAEGTTQHEVEGPFFRAVVDACRMLQTTRVPRTALMRAWLPGQQRIEGRAAVVVAGEAVAWLVWQVRGWRPTVMRIEA